MGPGALGEVRTELENGVVLDTAAMEFIGERTVVIDDGLIVEVADRYDGPADQGVDTAGRSSSRA